MKSFNLYLAIDRCNENYSHLKYVKISINLIIKKLFKYE